MRCPVQGCRGFSRADWFCRLAGSDMVRERSAVFGYTERHVKCVWYDPRLRPARLHDMRREPVEVKNPGRWNLEAGPDFLEALLLVGPERRRLAGAVEVHIAPADWRRHHHDACGAYRRVVAHVTYFPGYLPEGILPPGAIQLALQPFLAANTEFAFENLDLAAYPAACLNEPVPCARILAEWDAARLTHLLRSAGEERLRRKMQRMQAAVTVRGAGQVFYEEFMCALGYKHNRAPMRMLAERLSLAMLRETADGNPERAYALLAGVSGLLPQVLEGCHPSARRYLRGVWEEWWKMRNSWENCVLSPTVWRPAGVRPQNHPLRRLMAAALIFGGAYEPAVWWTHLQQANLPRRALQMLAQGTALPPGHFWGRHLGLRGGEQVGARLLGHARLAAILNNVVTPFLAALGQGYAQDFLDRLPSEGGNQLLRRTTRALLGPDHSPVLYRDGLSQQGLLQIGADFCLEMRGDCSACRLPLVLTKLAGDLDCRTRNLVR